MRLPSPIPTAASVLLALLCASCASEPGPAPDVLHEGGCYGQLAATEGRVFWVDTCSRQLRSIPAEGGPVEVWAGGDAVYVTERRERGTQLETVFVRYPVFGGPPVEVAVEPDSVLEPEPSSWGNWGPTQKKVPHYLRRYSYDLSEQTTLAGLRSADVPNGIVTTQSRVFWRAGPQLLSADLPR